MVDKKIQMICYKDMTFCPFHETCHNPCFRALTNQVRAAAEEWWGDSGAPISVFADVPKCHDTGDKK
jgi:hypothetical protein